MGIQKITSGKTTKYRVQIRKRGFPARNATFATLQLAEAWHYKQLRLINSGKADTVAVRKHTVADLIKRYIKMIDPPSAKLAHLKWWNTQIGFLFVGAVTPQILGDHLDDLAGSNKTLGGTRLRPSQERISPATVNRYHSSISSVFKYGSSRKVSWLQENPALFEQMKEAPVVARFLDKQERKSLMIACQDAAWPGLYPLVLLGLTTGARLGNLLNLHWSDIDLEEGLAHVGMTKNGKPITLPLTGTVLIEIRRCARVRDLNSDLLFPAPTNKEKVYGNFRLHWNKAVNDANLKAHFRFHDLRHTAGSYMAQAGVNQATIMKAMGHTTLASSERYLHVRVDDVAAAQAKVAKKFGL